MIENQHVEQVEVAGQPEAPATTQSYNAPFAVNISFPEAVVIKMVDATALNDYEFALFICSLFTGGFVGFGVAYLQATDSGAVFLVMTILLFVAAFAFLVWALMKRRKMTSKLRAFKLKTGAVEEIKD